MMWSGRADLLIRWPDPPSRAARGRTMSKHQRRAKGTSPSESGEDAREERLRSLYQAVYPPEFPPVKASEALRRRVTEVTERQSARSVRRWRGWSLPIGWTPIAGVLAAALLFAVVGLTLGRL